MNRDAPSPHLHVCRAGFADALAAEIRDRTGAEATVIGADLVRSRVSRRHGPFTFERQRLPVASFVEGGQLHPLDASTALEIVRPLNATGGTWSLHAFSAGPDPDGRLDRRLAGFTRAFRRVGEKEAPATTRGFVDDPHAGAHVLQFCYTQEGLWYAACPRGDLADPQPGGVWRMKMDHAAPSRSFLKIEEVLARSGWAPRAGERIVDLGAAPGGWSYAFLRRGCIVTAVDRGRPRLSPSLGEDGRLEWLKRDGITFEPPRAQLPLDGMVADMLIPPGVATGLLRKWLDRRWARRFVVNVKLPQQEPYKALRPLLRMLERRHRVAATTRQLYHDRREITVWGEVGSRG